jgi:hypothetical protein
VGAGWHGLADELQARLRLLEPPGELLGVGLDDSGLLRFRARLDPSVRAEGKKLLREYERRATELCELCGGPGRVRAGVVLTVRCPDCEPVDLAAVTH